MSDTFTLRPKDTDDSMFIISAFRYALGRKTYAVGCVADVLIRLAPHMTPRDRHFILGEIREAIHTDRAGANVDEVHWLRVADAMEDAT